MRKRNTFAGIIFLSFVLFYTVYTFQMENIPIFSKNN